MKKFPHYRQLDAMDCSPTCLRMVAKYYGQSYDTQPLRAAAEIGKDGVNLLGIAQAAESIGFKTLGVLRCKKVKPSNRGKSYFMFCQKGRVMRVKCT